MTISVSREVLSGKNTEVKIQMTYGPIQASCVEDVGHIRSVWSELGRLIEQIDAERALDEQT